MPSTNWQAMSGSSSAPSSRVSALARITVTGVRSSWDALATKSRLMPSTWRRAVMSCSSTIWPPSDGRATRADSTLGGGPTIVTSARGSGPA